MAGVLWLFCGATINTLGEYKPPQPTAESVPHPTSLLPPGAAEPMSRIVGDSSYADLTAENVVIGRQLDAKARALPDVDTILHDGVWFIEVGIVSVALLLLATVAWRFATAHDCWRWRTMRPVRLALNLARQKGERASRTPTAHRKNE